MSQSGNSELSPRQHPGEEISAWKAEIESFFETDWGRLRRLIMRLEEKSWANDDCPDTITGSDVSPDFPGLAEEEVVTERAVSGLRIAETAMNDAGLKRYRLAKLAEQIEHRIKSAHAELR